MNNLKFKIKHSKLVNQAMGVSTYTVKDKLPNDMKGLLPTSQEIEDRLSNLLREDD